MRSTCAVGCLVALTALPARTFAESVAFLGWAPDGSFYLTSASADGLERPSLCLTDPDGVADSWPESVPRPAEGDDCAALCDPAAGEDCGPPLAAARALVQPPRAAATGPRKERAQIRVRKGETKAVVSILRGRTQAGYGEAQVPGPGDRPAVTRLFWAPGDGDAVAVWLGGRPSPGTPGPGPASSLLVIALSPPPIVVPEGTPQGRFRGWSADGSYYLVSSDAGAIAVGVQVCVTDPAVGSGSLPEHGQPDEGDACAGLCEADPVRCGKALRAWQRRVQPPPAPRAVGPRGERIVAEPQLASQTVTLRVLRGDAEVGRAEAALRGPAEPARVAAAHWRPDGTAVAVVVSTGAVVVVLVAR